MILLLDTNIVIDYLQKREPFVQSVKNLLLKAVIQNYELLIAANSIDNIYYILSKKLPARSVLDGLKQLLTIASIAAVDDQIIRRAIDSNWKDLEDAIQYYSALSAKADLIVTRDLKGYEEQKVEVVTPEEALKLLKG